MKSAGVAERRRKRTKGFEKKRERKLVAAMVADSAPVADEAIRKQHARIKQFQSQPSSAALPPSPSPLRRPLPLTSSISLIGVESTGTKPRTMAWSEMGERENEGGQFLSPTAAAGVGSLVRPGKNRSSSGTFNPEVATDSMDVDTNSSFSSAVSSAGPRSLSVLLDSYSCSPSTLSELSLFSADLVLFSSLSSIVLFLLLLFVAFSRIYLPAISSSSSSSSSPLHDWYGEIKSLDEKLLYQILGLSLGIGWMGIGVGRRIKKDSEKEMEEREKGIWKEGEEEENEEGIEKERGAERGGNVRGTSILPLSSSSFSSSRISRTSRVRSFRLYLLSLHLLLSFLLFFYLSILCWFAFDDSFGRQYGLTSSSSFVSSSADRGKSITATAGKAPEVTFFIGIIAGACVGVVAGFGARVVACLKPTVVYRRIEIEEGEREKQKAGEKKTRK